MLIADGLRYDVARQLQQRLEEMGMTGALSTRWAGLPTVTATAQPAITPLIDAGWRSVKVGTDHGWLFCPDGLPTAAWSWNPSEQFATPSGAACFNTGGSTSYAHGGISLQECLTPVLVVCGGVSTAPAAAITEISWKGLRCNLEVSGGTAGMKADLRREAAGGPSVATAAKPVDDGGARLLVEDDELEGAAVVAVLLSPDGRVIAQRRTVVGGEA